MDGTITSPKLVRTVDNAQLGVSRSGARPAEGSIGIRISLKLFRMGGGATLVVVDGAGNSPEVVDGQKAAIDVVGSSPEVVGLWMGIS